MILDNRGLSKGSNKKVVVKCDNCGIVFERPYKNISKSNTHSCCKACGVELKKKKAYSEFESKIGEDPYAYLYREYIEKQRTTRQIAKDVYGSEKNSPNISAWIKKLGIELRHGSEAVKTQWINNDERRKQASDNMKSIIRDMDLSFMQTEEYKKKVSDAKKGSKNPMYGIKGENSPRWNPNRTHKQRVKERKTYEYSEWRKSVFNKDNYTCQCCGDNKGGNLVAHHLNSYHEHISQRYDINNGITLCETCHKKFHSIYKYGNNTKEQFEEFINNTNKTA